MDTTTYARAKFLANRALIAAIATLAIASAPIQSGFCGNEHKAPVSRQTNGKQQAAPIPQTPAQPAWEEDVILVMPNATADKENVAKAISDAHGIVVDTIGQGELTVLKVKVEKGKLAETEKKFAADKNFSSFQRNYSLSAQIFVTDPKYYQEWHIPEVRASSAWQAKGGSTDRWVAVLDSGTNYWLNDMAANTVAGYDAVNKSNGAGDVQGHGTMVASTIDATVGNGIGTAGVCLNAKVEPVRIANRGSDGKAYSDSAALLRGILWAAGSGDKIINLSYNSNPPYSLSNARVNTIFHLYARWFHDWYGGLLFMSAGNGDSAGRGVWDSSPRQNYLVVVSALQPNGRPSNFSNYGNPVWFSAPGENIWCLDTSGRPVSVAGTSFSAPIVAGIAAMVWGVNRGMTNDRVLDILKQSCIKRFNHGGGANDWDAWYGFGMPHAMDAVEIARYGAVQMHMSH